MVMFNSIVSKIIKISGIEVRRSASEYSDRGQLVKILKHHNIETILDVGANKGQYATTIWNSGFKGRIISFEPQTDCHEQLLAQSRNVVGWDIYSRCALGRSEASLELNISKNSVSSSFFPLIGDDDYLNATATYIDTEKVEVFALDDIWDSFKARYRPGFLLKLDTQGFEGEVISGANNALRDIDIVQLEAGIEPIYEGEKEWMFFIQALANMGFKVIAMQKGYVDPISGHGKQVDLIFARLKN